MVPSLSPSESTARQAALLELSTLSAPNHLPLGVWLLPSSNPLLLHGIYFVHRGYYADSILKFTISLPPTYPNAIPTVTFLSPLPFHPLVDARTGVFNLDGRWTSWQQGRDFLWILLHYIKGCFKRRALDEVREIDAVNAEAYRAYRRDGTLFAKLAAQASRLSMSDPVLFGTQARGNGEGIVFRKLDPGEEEGELERIRGELHEVARARVVKRKGTIPQ